MLCLSLPKACFLLTSGLEAVEVAGGSMAALGFFDFVTGAETELKKKTELRNWSIRHYKYHIDVKTLVYWSTCTF